MGNADREPLISVIVPVYKVEPYLHACVDSILAQTYQNLEIILVDDGSPDRCGQICDEYAAKDARVIVIHKENGGASAARNDGIKHSTGEYLTFIDSDDTVSSDWIAQLYASIGSHDFVIAGVTYVGTHDTRTATPPNTNLTELAKCSLLGYTWNKLFRTSSLIGHRFYPGLREDLLFNLSLVASGKSYALSQTCGYNYYQRADSLLHTLSVPAVQTVFDFDDNLRTIAQSLSPSNKNLIYNYVMFSYTTDHIYKMLLSATLSEKEKKNRIKQIISYPPFKKYLKKSFADNTLYRILHLGITLNAEFIVRYGFKLCQKH